MHNRNSRRGKRRTEIKNIFDEIMAENFPNLKKETDTQIQKAQKVPNKMNTIRYTQTRIIIKKAQVKRRGF